MMVAQAVNQSETGIVESTPCHINDPLIDRDEDVGMRQRGHVFCGKRSVDMPGTPPDVYEACLSDASSIVGTAPRAAFQIMNHSRVVLPRGDYQEIRP